jgi:hypothetical protein
MKHSCNEEQAYKQEQRKKTNNWSNNNLPTQDRQIQLAEVYH